MEKLLGHQRDFLKRKIRQNGLSYKMTRDTPDGDFAEIRARGGSAGRASAAAGFIAACRDSRVWALFVIYGACFGMELTLDNIAALYFTDNFHLALTAAFVAGPACPFRTAAASSLE